MQESWTGFVGIMSNTVSQSTQKSSIPLRLRTMENTTL